MILTSFQSLRAENAKLLEQREPIAPHRLRGLAVQRLDQVWATDATCVLTGQGWLYLVTVLDLFSRRVVGWAMSQLLDASLVIAALRMALSQRRPAKSLIVHSDRGSQFASAAYRQLLTQHDLTASTARKGNCYDNAFIESFFSSSNTNWFTTTASSLSPKLVALSSITSKPSRTASDSTPDLTTKAQPILNPN